MSIKSEIENLKHSDIWSLLLFVLFKVKDQPEYASLSELAYILDKKNMLRLCEYFGGTTLYIPTIEEFETLIYALLLFQYVDIEHKEMDASIELIRNDEIDIAVVKQTYRKLKETMDSYILSNRSKL